MRRLRHAPSIAAKKCDTPGLSQPRPATLGWCRMPLHRLRPKAMRLRSITGSGPNRATRHSCRRNRYDTQGVSQHLNATLLDCRTRQPATLYSCRMRHTQCLMGHRKQPRRGQRLPLAAARVPKLALLLLVIFRHQNDINQLFTSKTHNQNLDQWQAFLKCIDS